MNKKTITITITALFLIAIAFALITNKSNRLDPSSFSGTRGNDIKIPLKTLENSGRSGEAVVKNGGQLEISVILAGVPKNNDMEKVYIREGSCENLGGIKYPLNPISENKSVTVLSGTTLEDIVNKKYVINVHQTLGNVDKEVACGNLP